ncbi:MAG: transcriptional regulator [Bacteroidota bacterium]|nr:MarR family transcriptional regulator [Christiangramia sp.]MEE2770899.1 transcriptional regulator [Bacteroidota bacterium]
MNNLIDDQEKALQILKNKGEITIKELAELLGITTEGARFQIMKLDSNGLVKSENRSKGRGRPKQFWSLTAKGHSRFPDAHAEMTVKLIEKIRTSYGEAMLEEVINATSADNRANYSRQITTNDSLSSKVEKLAAIRDREGYMAKAREQEDGSFLLVENHCPICSAAKVCQGFCRAELQTFREVLGENVEVERVEHILSGARRCAYVVKEK